MPHTRSAEKNLRKSEKRRARNRMAKKAIRKQLKAFTAAAEGPVEELRKEFLTAVKKLDKAAARKIIHPNMAARKKSQLARKLHSREKAPAKPA